MMVGGRTNVNPFTQKTTLELSAEGTAWQEVPELELDGDGNQKMNAIVYNI